jgi:hypothetical protein
VTFWNLKNKKLDGWSYIRYEKDRKEHDHADNDKTPEILWPEFFK